MVMRKLTVIMTLVLGFVVQPVLAADFKIGHLTIENPWSRATPGKARSGVAYLTISNHGKVLDKVVSISTPAAKRADIHRTQMKDGMMTMRPMGELILRPGSSVLLRPGGMHVMLMGLTAPLKKGGSFDLTLNFEKAGSLTVKVGIEKIGARAPAAAHGQGHSGSH
jgi:periplasmic copper chaperone A